MAAPPDGADGDAVIVYLHISGRRSAARVRVLADLERALRPPHREAAIRSDCRRRHARRTAQRAGRRADGGLFGIPAMLPLLAVLQLRQRLAGATAGGRACARPSAARTGRASSRRRRRVRAAGHRRGAVPAPSRRAGAARHDRARRWSTTCSRCRRSQTFGRGDHLLRFFAIYYAATSILTFIIQTSSSRVVLERFGLGVTTEHAVDCAARSAASAACSRPGFGSLSGRARRRIGLPQLAVPRRLRAVLHADSGGGKARREVDHRRGVRSPRRRGGRRPGAADDCCCSRPLQSPAILSLAMACSAAAVFAASRLNRGYIGTLESSLAQPRAAASISPTWTTRRPAR